MDIADKINLIKNSPTEEIVTESELLDLLNKENHPKHYIGLEMSGPLHLGSLFMTGNKINDFIKAGVKTIFIDYNYNEKKPLFSNYTVSSLNDVKKIIT